MLKQEHIDWYREEISRATLVAFTSLKTSEQVARSTACRGCMYCKVLERHKQVLRLTSSELICLANALSGKSKSTRSFPKKMTHDTTLYKGFILDTGEYVDLFETDHSEYRRMYAATYGIERAFRIIKVHSYSMKNQVLFYDRKYPPTQAQYTTLRELMVDAEGALCFHFVYDTNHPS